MAAALITKARLELRVGAQTLARFLDDDGDGNADADPTEEVLLESSQIARGILLSGFTLAQIDTLAEADLAVRGAICDIACDLMARRRLHLLNDDGKTPYSGFRDRAEALLKRVAAGDQRSAGEEEAGANATIAVTTSLSPVSHIFRASKANPTGPGGF